ncbi:MAG: HDOD domain-containing protein [Nitrosomonas sp.]|nr:HDOD domain-containing protein [Nitrosomonas sp.]
MIDTHIPMVEAADENDEDMSIKDKLIDMIHNDPNLPTIGNSISNVVQLTSSESKSIGLLTNLILTDPSLSLKILHLANSLTLRVSTQEVTSISKAIQLLGLDTIKTCALAMILVDGMPRKHANAVRTELMIALSASLIGRNLAKRSAFPNAEEVAIAALFKNVGRLILAAFDDQLYRETMSLALENDYSESKASQEKLGCTFHWLTDFALRAWNIPDSIIQAMKLMPGRILKSPKNRTEWMQQVTEFSNSAALMTLRDGSSQTTAMAEELARRFGVSLKLDAKEIHGIVHESAAQLRSIRSLTDMPQQESTTSQQPNSDHEVAGGLSEVTGDVDLWINQSENRFSSGKPINAADRLLEGVQEVTELLATQQFNINTLLTLVLETYYRCLGFEFVTVCLKDVRTNQFRARNSLGKNHDVIQQGFVFPDSASSDLFSIALKRNVDLAISDATDPKINSTLPNWHKRLLPETKSFMVLPLVVQNKPIGLIYADRSVVASEGITASEMKLIKALKANVLVAFNNK